MIKYIKNTTLYIIAFLLFLFGNTVNVIHFCCDLCRTQGTEVFTENNCHDNESIESVVINSNFDYTSNISICSEKRSQKESINTSDNSGSCVENVQIEPANAHNSNKCQDDFQNKLPFQLNHQHNSCSLETISIILDYYHQNINVIPVVLTLYQDLNEQLQNLAVSAAKSVKKPLYTSAVHLSGRNLLNNICVLRN